jgi:hypothetical protein
LRMEGDLAHGKSAAKAGGLEFHELCLDADSVDAISEVDLRRVPLARTVKAAIFSQAPSRPLTECVTGWRALGLAVDSFPFDGLEPLLCPDTQGYKEPAATDVIVGWMQNAIPPQHHPAGFSMGDNHSRLAAPGWVETAWQFGPQQRLFGIVCQPDGRKNETAVIIVNTGRNPRTGVGRFGVEFARRLAREGVTSLRFDFAGLGDSTGPAGAENIRSDVFEVERLSDISAAIDALETLGCRRFAVHGVCSGAYHALHAAESEARIEAVLMVNLPLFLWTAGDSIAESKKRSYSPSHYRARLLERQHWLRLLRGESDVLGILKGQIMRVAKNIQSRAARGTPAQDGAGFARGLMSKLSRRRTRTLFLFDPDHAGAYEIQNMFGKDGGGLKSFEGARIDFVPGLGEALAGTAARKTAADMMMQFMTIT